VRNDPRPRSSGGRRVVGDSARYLYAITRGLQPGTLADLTGLDGGQIEVVEHRGLEAVVSDVDLDEYGEEALKRNLEQLDWLEAAVRVHDAVIQAVTARGPTAPLRLATICLDDEGVRRRLDEWFYALQQILDRVDGRMEWSVKVLAPPEQVPVGAPAGGDLGGADYLRRKRATAEARAEAEAVAARVGDEVHDALSSMSVASRRLPPQDPRLTGHVGTMLLNSAYLIAADDSEAFTSRVTELATSYPTMEVSCVGPWPPYSFAMLEQR
jgi:hypothetical protein